MMPSRLRRAAFALAVLLAAADPAAAQRPSELPFDARIKVNIIPLDGERNRGIAYLQRLDADSLRFRFEGASDVTAVPWARVQELEVSEGIRTYPFAHHAKNVAGFTALGAFVGLAIWLSCRDPEEPNDLACIVAPGRLGTTTQSWALIAFGAGAVNALVHRKGEQWREVPKPGAVRLSVRPAGGGLGVGLSIAF